MAAVLFFLAGIGAIAGAIGVVSLRNPFFNVLALVFHLISLAALFLLLRAEFVAAAQVVVYAGAVMVLYVFVVAYVGGADEPLRSSGGPTLRTGAVLFAGALLVELCIAILGSGLQLLDTRGAGYDPNAVPAFGTPGYIGELLLRRFLFPFEAASFLLLLAAVGAIVLAKRRDNTPDQDAATRLSVADLMSASTGTMAEAASGGHTARGAAPETTEAGP
ncbi:MAG TPA: NADH-quinone oxidoreductase subunit J [Solirubrobacteraceae bacterium]|jgi:NADH:ubiquinone oxidoreductase subunit 6 (subunit J)